MMGFVPEFYREHALQNVKRFFTVIVPMPAGFVSRHLCRNERSRSITSLVTCCQELYVLCGESRGGFNLRGVDKSTIKKGSAAGGRVCCDNIGETDATAKQVINKRRTNI